MAGRHGRDAAGVEQSPGDDARENFPGFRFAQQIGERSFCFARGEFAGGGEKIFWRRSNLFGEPTPVEAVNGFDGNNFAQRLNRPRGLGARAAIIFAAQAGGCLRRARGNKRRRAGA